jgi:serine/threonine-protein kinase
MMKSSTQPSALSAPETGDSCKPVKLLLQDISGEKKELVFGTPAQCLVGRGPDCDLRLRTSPYAALISRHHCVFDIDPPYICVRDVGSRNGTYVNGTDIGHRGHQESVDDVQLGRFHECELTHGDEVRIGDTLLTVVAGCKPNELT